MLHICQAFTFDDEYNHLHFVLDIDAKIITRDWQGFLFIFLQLLNDIIYDQYHLYFKECHSLKNGNRC